MGWLAGGHEAEILFSLIPCKKTALPWLPKWILSSKHRLFWWNINPDKASYYNTGCGKDTQSSFLPFPHFQKSLDWCGNDRMVWVQAGYLCSVYSSIFRWLFFEITFFVPYWLKNVNIPVMFCWELIHEKCQEFLLPKSDTFIIHYHHYMTDAALCFALFGAIAILTPAKISFTQNIIFENRWFMTISSGNFQLLRWDACCGAEFRFGEH